MPRAGASGIVFQGRSVLLVQRGRGARSGMWSPPGGHIEPGETARDAAMREIREETGVVATLDALVDVHDVILHDAAGRLQAHYLLAVYCGRHISGEPVAASDAAAACFVPLDDIGARPLTPGAHALIIRAAAIVFGSPVA
jgi:8-oxo-dGTP diphosphatase